MIAFLERVVPGNNGVPKGVVNLDEAAGDGRS
jgi:hypothetical protein